LYLYAFWKGFNNEIRRYVNVLHYRSGSCVPADVYSGRACAVQSDTVLKYGGYSRQEAQDGLPEGRDIGTACVQICSSPFVNADPQERRRFIYGPVKQQQAFLGSVYCLTLYSAYNYADVTGILLDVVNCLRHAWYAPNNKRCPTYSYYESTIVTNV
jgi:hypothetical protein